MLERAAEVIDEGGIEALSLRGLARDLGVSHSAPMSHFADRTALLAALAKEGFRRSVEMMKAGAEAAGPDPVARYRALGRSYVRFAVEQPAYFRAVKYPEIRALADEDLAAAKAAFVQTMREGAEAARDAGWHPDTDPAALVAFSVAAAMGAANLFGDPDWRKMLGLGSVEDAEALADAVIDLVVHRSRTTALQDAAPSSASDDSTGKKERQA